MYTVRGEKPSEEQVDKMIESGESETIFQQAILEQGRGRVRCPTIPVRKFGTQHELLIHVLGPSCIS